MSANYHRTKMQKEIVLQRLKENGCRITKQRKILLDIILQEECASCKEIYYKASKTDSSIGVATVYRMVNLLEEIGAISRKNMYRISCGVLSPRIPFRYTLCTCRGNIFWIEFSGSNRMDSGRKLV